MLVVILTHLIGAIIAIIIHFNNGIFENASKYGDGVRFARPSDVVCTDLILWEFQLIILTLDFVGSLINTIISKKFSL